MKVLVLGGTQFNGLALVHELVRCGHDVTVCNRGRTPVDLPEGVTRLVADRTDHAGMREVLGGREWDCVQDMTAYHPSDTELALELFTDRVGHYVFASSTVIYAATRILPIDETSPTDRGPDQNEYGLHKLLCEDRLLEAHVERGFPATTVPFSMVFGPHNSLPDREQRMFARMLAGRPVLVPGDGTTLGQVGHVDDQARALEAMMGRPETFGRRFNLTGAQFHTDEGYVDTFADVVSAAVPGVEVERVHVPAEVMDALWDGELEFDLGGGPRVTMDIRSSSDTPADPRRRLLARRFAMSRLIQRLAPNLHRWNANVVFSIDALRRDVGWEPRHTFASMVADTYEWYQRTESVRDLEFDWTFEDQLLAHLGHRRG